MFWETDHAGAPVGRLRGKLHYWRETPVVCTYHPSYVLRSPERARRPVWEDMQFLMAEMGIEIPAH